MHAILGLQPFTGIVQLFIFVSVYNKEGKERESYDLFMQNAQLCCNEVIRHGELAPKQNIFQAALTACSCKALNIRLHA